MSKKAGYGRHGFYDLPEVMSDLWLECTACSQQPHFAVDPGWPPPAPAAPPVHRPADWKPKPPKVPHVFPPGHVLSVVCPVCQAEPSRVCRDVEGKPSCSHDARALLAWRCPKAEIAAAVNEEVEARRQLLRAMQKQIETRALKQQQIEQAKIEYAEIAKRLRFAEEAEALLEHRIQVVVHPVRVTSIPPAEVERILNDIVQRDRVEAVLRITRQQIREAQEELAAVEARIRFHQRPHIEFFAEEEIPMLSRR